MEASEVDGGPVSTCCICFEQLMNADCQRLACGHTLHEKCVRQMRRFGSVGRCPLCRQTSNDLTPIQDLIDLASACRVRDDNVECARLASEVLVLDSTNVHANLLLGELCRSGHGVHKDTSKAIELLEAGWMNGSAKCVTQLGVLYGDLGDHSKAKELYEEGRRRGDTRAALNLGVYAMEEDNNQQAREYFTEAIFAGDAGGFTYMGMLYEEADDTHNAELFYQTGWRRGHTQALFYLGALRHDQGRLDEAIRLLELSHRLGDSMGSMELGEIYKEQGHMSLALEIFTEAWLRGDESAGTEAAALQSMLT